MRGPGPAWGASAAAVAAAAPAAAAGTGRPQNPAGSCRPRRLPDHRPPPRVPPWPGQGLGARGLRESRRGRADTQASPTAAAGTRRVSPARPPERASERTTGCTHARGLCALFSRSPAAACCGSRRRDTGWACPGRGRGAPARARPTQRQGAGPGRARALGGPWARAPSSLGQGLGQASAPAGAPHTPAARAAAGRPHPPRPSFLLLQPGQRKPRFSGARPRTEEGCRQSAPAPRVSGDEAELAATEDFSKTADLAPAPGFLRQEHQDLKNGGAPAASWGPQAAKFYSCSSPVCAVAQGPRVQSPLARVDHNAKLWPI